MAQSKHIDKGPFRFWMVKSEVLNLSSRGIQIRAFGYLIQITMHRTSDKSRGTIVNEPKIRFSIHKEDCIPF